MRFDSAVVVGRFLPPHHGHKLLIETALEESRAVTVIVCERPSDFIPADVRASWLREIHPAANVIVIDDRDDENDPNVWATNTIRQLGRAPDAVFTSEAYGDPYARAMNCAHVEVDRPRARVPITATAIRRDPYKHWQFLDAPVRAWFAKRICVVGAESTGKTTLADGLAAHYQTNWVPEYGREYSAAKLERGETEWTSEEFVHIANEQNAREDRAARDANRVLICDTNAWATFYWHRRHMGIHDDRVSAATRARCDLYLLTGDDIPFVQDEIRDGEHLRHTMHQWFSDALGAQETPWLLLCGDHKTRLETAIAAIDRLLSTCVSPFDPSIST